ncbi:unnamed protein product [Triticum turgidum subsp. durum]|uniref:H15 domain-containing protein n=1 Tax=Triticum turgidum subsp. durum TaxID=4567 RepID=A0A9R0QKV9_TRITD|nr:unnamed protein product [Triticum turgidum subsp. durum]
MVVASPSTAPPPTDADGSQQPTYPEMIKQALTELGGTSGRIAIAAFILGRFKEGLPAAHDKLLRVHLRRLVSQGVVRGYGSEARACYVFPASNTKSRGRPRKSSTRLLLTASPTLPLPLPAPPTNEYEENLDLSLDTSSGGLRSSRGRPLLPALPAPKNLLDLSLVPQSGGSQISSDDDDDDDYSTSSDDDDDDDEDDYSSGDDKDDEYTPARAYALIVHGAKRGRPRKRKRGPGRTRKLLLCANSSVTKKGRGRPRKKQKLGSSQAAFQNGTPGGGFSTPKRGRGRPRKDAQGLSTSVKRGRGRPRKDAQGLSIGVKKGRGRPRKESQGMSTGVKSGRGRPRKEPEDGVPEADSSETESDAESDSSLTGSDTESGSPNVSRWLKEGFGNPITIATPPAAVRPASRGLNIGSLRPTIERPPPAARSPGTLVYSAASAGMKKPLGRPRKKGSSKAPAEAASTGIKKPRGRPRKERPPQAMSAQAGDAAAPAPETGNATPAPETGHVNPASETRDAAASAPEAEAGDASETRDAAASAPEAGDAAATAPGENGDAAAPAPDENGAGTPAKTGDGASTGIKRPRGRPRKERSPAPMSRETGDAAPDENGAATPAEAGDAASTGFKKPRGRPRKEKPPASISAETGDATPAGTGDAETGDATPAGTGDAETGDVTPTETGAATPAEGGNAASTGIKRPLGRPRKVKKFGRPRKEKPEEATMSDETGDDAGDARSAETGAATPGGDSASAGVKRGRGRPRKERPEAAISAESGDAETETERKKAKVARPTGDGGIKRGLGRPRKVKRGRPQKEKPASDDAMSTGIKGPLESPRSYYALSAGTGKAVSTGTLESPRTAEKPSAGDIVSMVMRRRRAMPRSEQPSEAGRVKSSGGIFGYVRESSGKQEKEGLASPGEGEKTPQTKEGVVAALGGGEETGLTADAPVSAEKAIAGDAAVVEGTGGATEACSDKLGSCAISEKSASGPRHVEAVGGATESSSNKLGRAGAVEAENAAEAGKVEKVESDKKPRVEGEGGEDKLGSAERCVATLLLCNPHEFIRCRRNAQERPRKGATTTSTDDSNWGYQERAWVSREGVGGREKEQQPQAPTTPTEGIKRGRGRPRKGATTTSTDDSN